MAKKVGKQEITLNRIAYQWKNKPHKFSLNIWNFEILAGRAAVGIFQKSFDLKRFNSNGSTPWTQRASTRYKHPLMVQTGSLKQSIKWKHLGQKGGSDNGVLIYTNPKGFNHTASHKGFCYAAVHNAKEAKYRTGRVANMPRRQFMGHSTELKEELKRLSSVIFEGFP